MPLADSPGCYNTTLNTAETAASAVRLTAERQQLSGLGDRRQYARLISRHMTTVGNRGYRRSAHVVQLGGSRR